MSMDDASHYEVTPSRGRKGKEKKNGGSFERDESCWCRERLVVAWQRFRLVDDGIFNENRRPLVGRKQGGTTQTPFNLDIHGGRDFVRCLGPVQGFLLLVAKLRCK